MVKRNILLNPGPATTTDTVKQALVVPDICPREAEFGNLMQEIRKDLVKIARGDENYTTILFTGSGTAAMDSAISSVVPPNKKILILINGSYGVRFAEIAKTYNIDVVELNFEFGKKIELDKIKSILQADKNIECVAVTHHETTVGILNPIKEIGAIAKKYNKTFIVDTISSFAGVPINIKEFNIDFMMSTSNKCIQGMAGIAFIICSKKALEKLKSIKARNYYLDLYKQYEYLEKNNQTRFTPPVQIMYALKQAINEFYEEGADNRFKRYRENYKVLKEGLKKLGFKFLMGEDVTESNILTTIYYLDHPNFDFDMLHDKLYKRDFTIYPGKITELNTFRIAVMGAIYPEDIRNFLESLKEVLIEMDIIK
ncbi:MAG TPA: 2-aminoethylphosphonate--pyruvate transaminase [Candidatus Lokiarchaeia archaeon]